MWQDLILTFGNIILIFAMYPTVVSDNKPALSTSVLTSSVILIFAIIYGGLGLWLTTGAAITQSLIWGVVSVQTVKQSRRS